MGVYTSGLIPQIGTTENVSSRETPENTIGKRVKVRDERLQRARIETPRPSYEDAHLQKISASGWCGHKR